MINYWEEKLKGRAIIRTEARFSATQTVSIKGTSLSYFNKLTNENKTTEFTVLLAIFGMLFQRYFSDYNLISTHGSIFQVKQPLFYKFNGISGKNLKQYLQEVKKEVEEVYRYSNYFLDRNTLLKKNYTPFHFTYDVGEDETLKCYGLTINIKRIDKKELIISGAFLESFTEKEVVEHFIQSFKLWISNLEENLNKKVTGLDIVSHEEKTLLLNGFNNKIVKREFINSTLKLFVEQLERTPDQTAIMFEDYKLSYKELDYISNKYSRYLSDKFKIKEGDRVVVLLDHSLFLMAILLSIKKVGGIYVPVDPETPKERCRFIEKDSNSVLTIDHHLLLKMNSIESKKNEKSLTLESAGNEIECIIYTSGSTGIPKGVLINSKGVINRLNWMWDNYPFKKGEVCCAKTSIGFVDHIWELYGPLLKGIPLVFYKKENVINVRQFIESLHVKRVTRIVLVPSLLKALLTNAKLLNQKLQNLYLWISSGEELKESEVKRFYNAMKSGHVRLLNIYGSTEVTADATFYDSYDDYNSYKKFKIFNCSLKNEIEELISAQDFSTKITSNSLEDIVLENNFQDVNYDSNMSSGDYLHFLKTEFLPSVINVGSPSYIGHMTGPVPGLFRELNSLIIAINQNQVKIETSLVSTRIERQVIGIFHNLIYGSDDAFYHENVQASDGALGVVTNGGTMSNLTALNFTLNNLLKAKGKFKGIVREGLLKALKVYGYERVVLIGSNLNHYSFHKSLKIMGLGTDSFIEFNIRNKDTRLIREELMALIYQLKCEKALILSLVGIAGTTETGEVDPLELFGEIARQYDIHYHVDAAFGGGFLMDGELRKKLKGIELANSVSVCAHKQLYLPIGWSICIFKDPSFVRASENNTFYQARKGSYDLGKFTIEGSRNFMSLILHAAFKIFGKEGFAEIVRNNYQTAQYFARLIDKDCSFDLFYPPDLNIVVYRYIPSQFRGNKKFNDEELKVINDINLKIQKEQFNKGNSFVSYTQIKEKGNKIRHLVFRTVFMNPHTSYEDLESILKEQRAIANNIENKKEQYSSLKFQNKNVPIGRPIANVQVYILDEFLNIVPIGVSGEIYISGDCVSIGYSNPRESSGSEFMENPFLEGERLYKTGDLGKWRKDGNIEYIGRKDNQIKIRGNRIELREIENAILSFSENISQSVVVVKKRKEEDILIAFYTVKNSYIEISTLKVHLESEVPAYMLPNQYIKVNSFPLTSNGKIDKNALLVMEETTSLKGGYVAPSNLIEKKLVDIWEQVLGTSPIGVCDHFFDLGGHSLMISQIINAIQKELHQSVSYQVFFANPTVQDLQEALKKEEFLAIPSAPYAEDYPLTPSQYRFWLLSQLEGGNEAYQISVAVKLKGEINKYNFFKAFSRVIENHEILRTVFKKDEKKDVRQYILPKDYFSFSIDSKDFSRKKSPFQAVKTYVQKKSQQVFDLERAPLFKASLLKINSDLHIFHLSIHHIIGDGWSLGVLTGEVLNYYKTLQNGGTIQSPEHTIQFKDYAVWLQKEQNKKNYQISKAYWLKQFERTIPVLQLPNHKSRPIIKTLKGGEFNDTYHKEFLTKLKNFSHYNGVTLFTVLLSGVNVLLSKYSGQDDIIIGTPVAGREHSDLEDQIGLYINTLAIRTVVEQEGSFSELLQEKRKHLTEAYEHQNFPFDALIEELKINRDTSRSPLFDVMVVMHNQNNVLTKKESDSEIEISPYNDLGKKTSKFDLTFSFVEEEDALHISITYNTDIYDKYIIEQLLMHYKQLLNKVMSFPNKSLREIDFLSKEEKQELLHTFNDTEAAYPKDKTIIGLFQSQVTKTPNNIALVFEEHKLTYKELNELANQLADYLNQNYAPQPDQLIAIQLERSQWMIVAILAVLKTGSAYLPIDPQYPEERIQYMIQDSEPKAVINHELLEAFIDQKKQYKKNNTKNNTTQNNLAYVIYTSGSTGKPKGVMIENKSVVNFIIDQSRFTLASTLNTILISNVSFDASLRQIFLPLIWGNTIHVYDLLNNLNTLPLYINKNNVGLLNTTPSIVKEILEVSNASKLLSQIKLLIIGGEKFDCPLLFKAKSVLNSKALIVNAYGPSESCVNTSNAQLDETNTIVTIGKPISNTQIYILDEFNRLQPKGVIGEICISGDGLARGYLNRPDLTEEKFIVHPFIKGQRLYKTGDLGRWLPDGNIEYLGRKDSQVKVRGYRIELGEIENVLLTLEEVAQAVLMEQEEKGGVVIVAYIVAKKGGELDKNKMREKLGEVLPDYMLPTYYVTLEKIPLTANGKVDLKALPKVGEKDLIKEEYVGPRNERELALTNIWRDILGIDQVGVTDDFFELGGHSLKAVRLINKMDRLGYNLKLEEVFKYPTIAKMESMLRKITKERIPKAPKQEYYPTTSSQRRLWILSQFENGSVAYNMVNVLQVEGILDAALLQQAIDLLIDRHESLRTVFKLGASGTLFQSILSNNAVRCVLDKYNTSKEEEISSIINGYINHRFDLTRFPLLKIGVVNIDEMTHLLLFNLHHIVGDGWSLEVLSREIIHQYNHLIGEKRTELSDLPIQYKDYAYWRESELQKERIIKSRKYWHKQLSGDLTILEMPITSTRPKVKTYNGAQMTHAFSSGFLKKLKQLSSQNGATLFMTLIAGLNGLFYRYSGQTDIILGTPVAGREHASLEEQIGLYLNTLAIRTRFEPTDTFPQLIEKQKNILLQAYEHQNYPFDVLVGELSIKRDTSRSALFDILVVMQNQQDVFSEKETISGLKISSYKNLQRTTSHFDISFSFAEKEGKLHLAVDYNTDIYNFRFIRKLLIHLENFLRHGMENPSQSISRIDYITFEERQRLLYTLNDTKVAYPKHKTIVDLFEEQVRRSPEATAVVYKDRELTYRELDKRSNALANYLLSRYKVSAEDNVGVKLPRNEWLIISVLGILKSGAAYVPIDPEYPEERNNYIEGNSSSKVIVTETLIKDFACAKELPITRPDVCIKPGSIAYIIYTSGSTGKPKGVRIRHSNTVAFLNWSIKEFYFTDFDILYAGTSVCFDLSVFEMFYPLSIGKKIRIINNGLSIADHLFQDSKILINTVPSIVKNLVESGVSLKNVSAINMAGESLPINLSNTLSEYSLELRNLYGPSESTTYSSCFRIDKKHRNSIPIGKPISNTQFYILSEELKLQPEGVVGELFISGDSLAPGYLNQDDMSLEKFIDHPFKPGEQLYRTGDLTRWLPDGNMEFLGRKDDQVKIRGYRIELGEIEYVLKQEKGIKNAVVLIKERAGEKYIASYLQSKEIDLQVLRNNLLLKLPEYMVPIHFTILEEIPLTPNGKTDKNQLFQLQDLKMNISAYVAPTTDIQKQLAAIWEEILGVERVGINDDFFELGGHSLKATKLLAAIHEQFNINIHIQELFVRPTIGNLAWTIENIKWSEEIASHEAVKKIII